MILDAHDTGVALHRSASVVIVGAGPAGMTLARELGKAGPVLLVESGGLTVNRDVLALHDGDCIGIPYALTETRARQFGGSSALWNGYCAQFDPHDFAHRAWVPQSGWAFGPDTIEPYYSRAASILNLGDSNFDARDIARQSGVGLPMENDRVMPTVWRFGLPTCRFGAKCYDEFESSLNITALLNANVVDIRLDRGHSKVTEMRIRTLDGRDGRISADTFVLACGGLETPRILLNANSQLGQGIGNANGMVGRFFMEHPHVAIPGLIPREERVFHSWTAHGTYGDYQEFMSCIGLNPQWQEREKVLNARVHVYRAPDMRIDEPSRVGIFLEQAPNFDSRVTLSNEKDAIGMCRLRLNWRLGDLDWRSFEATAQAIAAEFESCGVGRMHPSTPAVARDDRGLLYTNHQLGTTRMSASEVNGVVDPNGRVHDLDNLYIAGGSTFPTASWANPTFTVIALSLRLADHLQATLH